MQKNATSSARSSAAIDQHDTFASPDNADSEGHAYTFPTLEQQSAIKELQEFDEDKIIAWISVIRSIEPGFQHRTSHGGLSGQHLDALSKLKDCHESDIVAWLQYNHHSDNVNKQRLKFSSASPSRHLRRSSSKAASRSSLSSLAQSSISSSRYSTPRSSFGYSQPLPQLVEGSAESEESDHAHWCTYGEHPNPVYTCEGWKRHEKEHERGFMCMPDGPVVDHRCAFCDKEDPSSEHLEGHKISLCTGSRTGPRKKSRKGDMIKHLAAHGICGPASAVLADKWRFNRNKKAYSCGFCVSLFSSITDRSNHIDNEHWKHNQTMSTWDLSNVIRGLLLQPEVQAAWQNILGSNSYLREYLSWRLPFADGLQLKLEMGEETGAVLAQAALELSSYGLETSSHAGLTSTARLGAIINGSSYPAARHSVATPIAPPPSSMYGTATSVSRPSTVSSRVRSPLPVMNSSHLGFHNSQRSQPQHGLAILPDHAQPASSWSQYELLPSPISGSGNSETNFRTGFPPLPAEWPSPHLSLPPDDDARIQGIPSDNEAILVLQVAPPRNGQSLAEGRRDRHVHNPSLRLRDEHPGPEANTSPSASVDGWPPHLAYHEHHDHSRMESLLTLHSNTYETAETLPTSFMDLDVD